MIQRKRRFRDRSGFTLIHQMVIIAVLPVLLLAAMTWVHESMKMSSRFKHRRETNVALNHFLNQFQNDVRSCKTFKLNADLQRVELTGHEGQQTLFQIDDGQIHKTLTIDGQVVGRESFRLSDEYFAEWDDATASAGRMALNVYRYPNEFHRSASESLDVPDPKLELVIGATANRWNRTVVFGGETVSESGGKK